MYALVDTNNMYASCERVFQPHLVGRPLVVLSSNDGACIARSNEAKALGVGMAQPWYQVRHLQQSHGLIAVSANFELYSDMSSRMMMVTGRFAPRQEVYSIDECFLDFDGVAGDLRAVGQTLRAAVLQEVGLPTSVGFGPTKTLAKLANHTAKTAERTPEKYPAHLRATLTQVCDFGSLGKEDLAVVMAATGVRNVWGVGRRIAEKLQASGVQSVLDLVRVDAATLRRQFGVVLEKTLRELQGTSCLEMSDVEDVPTAKQQILVSRSFGTPIAEEAGIVEAVSEFASRAAEKLRHQESLAAAVGVFFMTSPYRANDRQHSVNVTAPLVRPTADTGLLVEAAVAAVRIHFRAGFRYAKAGAVLSGLQPASVHQGELDLFPESTSDASRAALPKDRTALMEAMDVINRRFGRDAVRIGSTLVASHDQEVRRWATKQERRSPRFTTRWAEMPVVRA